MGVIERRGNRSFVVEHLPDVSFDQHSDRREFIRQLFETRRLLEVPIIELAAERASSGERDEIRALAERFTADITLQEFRELDRSFHSAIARACGNPLLVEVYSKVLGRLFHSEEISSLLSDEANRAEVGNIIEVAAGQHRALAAAVASGDVEAASRAGTEHLEAIERRMIDRLV
jgi:GntR family transcriptional repressor for pyruvate dehydrogenase complex